MYGEEDGLIDLSFATDFAEALTGAGSEALVEVVEGAQHNDMYYPDIVGDLIVTWLEAERASDRLHTGRQNPGAVVAGSSRSWGSSRRLSGRRAG